MFERARKGERALLIQPHAPGRQDPALLEEFSELARSAGATVVGTVTLTDGTVLSASDTDQAGYSTPSAPTTATVPRPANARKR